MINAVLVFNNAGQPRLTRFYHQLVRALHSDPCLTQDTSLKQRLIRETYNLIRPRPDHWCNFLPLPPLLQRPFSTASAESSEAPTTIVYRHYATLYFVMLCNEAEHPLAILDLIQVFVEVLDRLFENVCELDLVFNFETLHIVLGEMFLAGTVIETSRDTIVEGVRALGKIERRRDGQSLGVADVVGAGLGLTRPWR